MEKKLLIILLVLVLGCKNNDQGNEPPIEINAVFIQKYTPADKVIILTCTRCGCFVDALNTLNENEKSFLSKYPILTDTICNSLNIPSIFMDSKTMDSISTDIFNITLLKKKDNRFNVRIIKLNESNKIIPIIKDFFEL